MQMEVGRVNHDMEREKKWGDFLTLSLARRDQRSTRMVAAERRKGDRWQYDMGGRSKATRIVSSDQEQSIGISWNFDKQPGVT